MFFRRSTTAAVASQAVFELRGTADASISVDTDFQATRRNGAV